ncbi:hypothetical protein JCM8547_001526 [Rhodosporidiobolus lusitaniae]
MAPLRSFVLNPPPPSSHPPPHNPDPAPFLLTPSSSSPSSHAKSSSASRLALPEMSTTPTKRLPHSRHASRERPAGPADSVLTFESSAPLTGSPIYATVEPGLKRRTHKKLAILGLLLLVFFFLNAAWLWGSYYQEPRKLHNLQVAVVDFDGGAVGSALMSAIKPFDKKPLSPSYLVVDGASSSPADIQARVHKGEFWAAIYATSGASDRFNSAVANDGAAGSYNATNAIEYTGLQVRYNDVWGRYLQPALLQVVAGAQVAFSDSTVAPLLTSGTSYGSTTAAVIATPIGAHFVNLTPFRFGARVLLNTAGFVFPILLTAFFLSVANNVFNYTGYYRNLSFRSHLKLNLTLGLVAPLIVSLSTTVWYIFMDEDTYRIGVKYFFALWALLWVFSMVYFNLIQSLYSLTKAEGVSAANPLIIFTLVVLAVASTSHPLELQPAFFKIAYAFPSHATWDVAMVILGHGALKSVLKYELPVLAVWLVASTVVLHLALRKRSKEGIAQQLYPAVVPVKVER